ncbi:DUF305 domain-containing protein [Nocardia sp. A7]|uniref:DUF305 domain-containing protein n=1 Tax=Nocardia sp. A7 TaxID=2789274 RepID=UPI00397D6C47
MRHWAFRVALIAAASSLLVIGAGLRGAWDGPAAPVLSPQEIGFAQDMTTHHQQVLFMVQRLDGSADALVTRLARQIEGSQRIEIGTMLGWLNLAGALAANPHPMSWLPSDSSGHHHQRPASEATTAVASTVMPGMATQAELDRLATARGNDADVLFLQLMLRHHQGGIAMARLAGQVATARPVREAIQSMIAEQGQEAGLIGLMLTQRGAPALPYP